MLDKNHDVTVTRGALEIGTTRFAARRAATGFCTCRSTADCNPSLWTGCSKQKSATPKRRRKAAEQSP